MDIFDQPQPPNPIQDAQRWINEIGYEGSFQRPDTGSLLRNMLVGGGAGLTAGALADKNMWRSGVDTAAGAGLGGLLGNLLSKPENQATNSGLGALAGGGIGLGTSLLRKHKKHEVTNMNLPNLQLTAKMAGIGSFINQANLDKVHGQLPNVRVPDTLAGAGAGAGAGWLYNLAKGDKSKHDKWRRILGGAGIGAASANLVGDRARRYISNTILPYGYGKPYVDGDKQLSPASLMKPTLKKVWEAGIKDNPQQPGVADYLAGKYKEPNTEQPGIMFHNTAANMAARRELIRLGAGVDTHTDNSIWQQQPDGTYSLNPKHKNIDNLLKEFMFSQAQKSSPGKIDGQGFLNSPEAWTAFQNENIDGPMHTISGGQRIPVFPLKGQHGTDYLARLLKKWTVDPRPSEKDQAMQALKNKMLGHPNNNTLDNISYPTSSPEGNKGKMKSLAERWALEHLVMKNPPWVSQRMYFKQQPNIMNQPVPGTNDTEDIRNYAAIPSTASGEVYPNTVGYFDPKQPDIQFETLNALNKTK